METRFRENEYSGGIKEMRSTDYRDVAQEKKTNAIVTYRKKYLMLSKESVANIILQEGHLYGSALLKAYQKNGNPSMCKEAQIIFSDDISVGYNIRFNAPGSQESEFFVCKP